MAYQCEMCKERGKTWNGDDPRCAFDEKKTFTTHNWNCATMNELRERARQLDTDYRDDNAAASIGYVPVESDDTNGYVVLTWYKDRGRTGMAVVMGDYDEPRSLTEQDALDALAYSKHFLPEQE